MDCCRPLLLWILLLFVYADLICRTIPYFTDTIEPSIMEGKKVLIASSENAIRGMMMIGMMI